jgi:hypothetical protein
MSLIKILEKELENKHYRLFNSDNIGNYISPKVLIDLDKYKLSGIFWTNNDKTKYSLTYKDNFTIDRDNYFYESYTQSRYLSNFYQYIGYDNLEKYKDQEDIRILFDTKLTTLDILLVYNYIPSLKVNNNSSFYNIIDTKYVQY